jgi:hypothetical protein
MSAELKDLKRLKISAETRAWLQAEALSTGRSHQEIARDMLHSVAVEKIRAAKVLMALAPPEGHGGDSRGKSGSGRE